VDIRDHVVPEKQITLSLRWRQLRQQLILGFSSFMP